MAALDNVNADQFGEIGALDPHYNEIPETRGTGRNKGIFAGGSGRDRADAEKLRTAGEDLHDATPHDPAGCRRCQKASRDNTV